MPNLGDKQDQSIREATARVNLWHGSIRSGKTISSLLRWLLYVNAAPRGGELVIAGRTRDSIARNVFGPLGDPSLFGAASSQIHYNSGAPSAKILGRTVHVLGASDSKAEMVLRGLTCAGAYVDEVTTVQDAFFAQLLGRMSVPGAQLFGTTNPDSPAHWLKTRYLDRLHQLPDWRAWHFQLDDNPALPQAYKDAIKREYTGLWRRRFILGEWVAAEGAVYDMWDPDQHVIAWDNLPPMQRLIGVGLDYGTTNPTAGLLLGLSYDGQLYLVDEWRHDPKHDATRLTDGQLSESFAAWISTSHLPDGSTPPIEWIVADPSAASFRLQLARDGINTAAADNDVIRGIGLIATLLAEGQLLVSDRCRGFVAEAPGYGWDPDATLKGEDRPIKVADHSLDGGRYIVATTESLWRPYLRGRFDLAA